jgi:cation diffusion facilitator CzcD-associated flavoprotein CzcO
MPGTGRKRTKVIENASVSDLPVIVVGAGPVGLAAAAHLNERGLPFLVLEAGPVAASSITDWAQVRLFSPWRYNTDNAACRLLESHGWLAPDGDALPTGADLIARYLAPLAATPQIEPHIRYRARVQAISRLGFDRVRTAGREASPFVVRLADGSEVLGRAVIDASGTWTSPNLLGGNGLPALGERDARAWIDHALPDVLGADRDRYAGRHIAVVGAGHSAATTLLALAELIEQAPGTKISWVIRSASPDRAYGGADADALPARGALGSGLRLLVDTGLADLVADFSVMTVRPLAPSPAHGGVELVGRSSDGARRTLVADQIVGATGFRPDFSFLGEIRLANDPILEAPALLAPLIDPNLHSCGTVRPHGVDELTHPEPGYFAIGMKSYGRAPTFLLATGHEQARSVVAALAGDWTAARAVELELPETGVCEATLGVTAIAERFGLAPDVPAKLLDATQRHLTLVASPADAVLAAAEELGIERGVALQLAAFAQEQVGGPAPVSVGSTPSCCC